MGGEGGRQQKSAVRGKGRGIKRDTELSERRNGKGVEEAKNRGRERAETEMKRERRGKGG